MLLNCASTLYIVEPNAENCKHNAKTMHLRNVFIVFTRAVHSTAAAVTDREQNASTATWFIIIDGSRVPTRQLPR